MLQKMMSGSLRENTANFMSVSRFHRRNLWAILVVVGLSSCGVYEPCGKAVPFLDIEVATSRVGDLVHRATEGDARSFDDLKRTIADLDRGIAEVDSSQEKSHWTNPAALGELRKNLQIVVDARDVFLKGFESASKAVTYFQSAETKLLEASRHATESGKAASRVYVMMDSVVTLERLSANTSAFMTKGKGVEETGDWLARDLAILNLRLSALQNGNDDLAVKAEPDDALRAQLKAIAEEIEFGNAQVAMLLDATGAIEEVVAAASKIPGQATLISDAARSARLEN